MGNFQYFYNFPHGLVAVVSHSSQEKFEPLMKSKGVLPADAKCLKFIDEDGAVTKADANGTESIFVFQSGDKKLPVLARDWDEARTRLNAR